MYRRMHSSSFDAIFKLAYLFRKRSYTLNKMVDGNFLFIAIFSCDDIIVKVEGYEKKNGKKQQTTYRRKEGHTDS